MPRSNPSGHNRALRSALTVLLLTGLACSPVTSFFTPPGPENFATDVAGAGPSVTPTHAPASPSPFVVTASPPATPVSAQFLSLDAADDAQAAMRPAFAADVDGLPNATRYAIEVGVAFDGDGATLTGRAAMRYTNQQSFALASLYLMLWPNDQSQYRGSMTLANARVSGTPVEPILENGDLAARLPLETPMSPGASVELSVDFEVRARAGAENGGRFGLANAVLLAPTFYPLIPRIVDGQWQTEAAPPGGDTTNSDTSFYLWRVTAPAGLALVATGTAVEAYAQGDTQTQLLLTGPVRDLALAVGPLRQTQRVVDGITVNAYLLGQDQTAPQRVLDQAEAQLENLQARVGPYPYRELDLVDANIAIGGIEYPALVFVANVGSGNAERAIVHEIGHQWFYGLIGDDQLREPWLDEAAASYTEVLYDEATQGPAAAEASLDGFRRYMAASDNPELPIGLPVGAYPSPQEYGLLVYGKGALFFDALRQQLGDEVFFQFLHNYYAAYKYGFATSAGFQAEAERTCTCDLQPLFDMWVYTGGSITGP